MLSSFLQALLWRIPICLAAFHTFCVLHQKSLRIFTQIVLRVYRAKENIEFSVPLHFDYFKLTHVNSTYFTKLLLVLIQKTEK